MSFLTGFALLIGALVALPVLAHLLRRGKVREQPFAPILLLKAARTSARQKSRLDDRFILTLRALLILTLALLGAVPFVRCSRVSLARQAGASVALSLVIDDSLSMRAVNAAGKTRFSEAVVAAQQLMAGSREGDAVALVLAGAPARLALGATTDLGSVRTALSKLAPSDRSTDLETAVELARAAVKSLTHVDKRVAVFSDFAASPPKVGDPVIWVPLPSLQSKSDNCAIVSAEKSSAFVVAQIACTSDKAALGRKVVAFAAKAANGPLDDGEELGKTALSAKKGLTSVAVKLTRDATFVNVSLNGTDALSGDDAAPATLQMGALVVGVVVDKTLGSVVTGGATILEQVLTALDDKVVVRPLSAVPESDQELDANDLLILDDPAAFSPEVRAGLSRWLGHGKVAVSLFGPQVENAQLGSNFEPFLTGTATWQRSPPSQGLAAESFAWLGAAGASLEKLSPHGAVAFSPGDNTQILGRWQGNSAFLLEQSVGRGSAFSVGLPASVDESDLALRPGFVALLGHFVALARERSGPRVSEVGRSWHFFSDAKPTVIGPEGALASRPSTSDEQGRTGFEPALLGRYQVTKDGKREERVVTISADEVLQEPVLFVQGKSMRTQSAQEPLLEISPQMALVALGLFTLEMLLRGFRRFRRVRR